MSASNRFSRGPIRPVSSRYSTALSTANIDFDDSSFCNNPLKLKLFATFAPTQVLLRAMDTTLPPLEPPEYEVFEATLLFADISGFSALADRLTKAKGVEGMEVLNKVINSYFAIIARCINSFGGDVIKFSGDAMMAVWPVKPGQNDSLEKATLKAVQCGFLILQQRPTLPPSGKDTPIELQVHIGLGAGTVVGMHVGGGNDRCEYVIGGEPLQQITGAEHLAKAGEIVVSPQAWKLIQNDAEGVPVFDEDEIRHKGEDDVQALFFTPETRTPEMGSAPTIQMSLHKKSSEDDENHIAADNFVKITHIEIPTGDEKNFRNEQLARFAEKYTQEMGKIILKYTPEPLRMQFALGEMQRVGELRRVTIMFLRLTNLQYTDYDVAVPKLHEAMLIIQQALADYGGVISRLQIDDKGTVFKAAFGLPPRSHEDDPVRGLLAALQMVAKLREIDLRPCIGLATSTVFFGVVGSMLFREFSTVGSTVNLAARMMQAASEDVPILCEDSTYQLSKERIKFIDKQPIKCKGWKELIKIYQPVGGNTTYVRQLTDYPLRGRSNERKQLEQIVRQFVINYRKTRVLETPGINLVVGENGFGKSRLLSETTRTASGMSITCLRGRAEELFQASFLHPWKKIFAHLFRIDESDFTSGSLSEVRARVSETVNSLFQSTSAPIQLSRSATTPKSLLQDTIDEEDEDPSNDPEKSSDPFVDIMQSKRSLICANPFIAGNLKKVSKITGHAIEISAASKELTVLDSCNIDSEEISALLTDGKPSEDQKIQIVCSDGEDDSGDERVEEPMDRRHTTDHAPDDSHFLESLNSLNPTRSKRSISKMGLPAVGDIPIWATYLPLLNDIFPLQFPETPATSQLDGPNRTTALYQYLQSLLTALSHRYPVMITLEDIEWLDSPSWTLLQLLVYSAAPILFVCSLTKSPKDPEPSHLTIIPVNNRVILGPLAESGIRNHLCDVLQVKSIQKSLFEFIFNRSSGNPLVARQILLALKSRNEIEIVCNECQFNPTTSSNTLSDTGNFQALVAKRLDGLSPSQQFTLQVASVIGSRFTRRQLSEIFPLSNQQDRILSDLSDLLKSGLVVDVSKKYPLPPDDVCFGFEYLLIHEVCYNMLAFQVRKQLHEAVAKWCEEMKAKNYSRTNLVAYSLGEETIAQHWDKGENFKQASFYWERAGIGFIMKSCYNEAVQCFDKACQGLLKSSDIDLKRQGDLLINLGEACVLQGNYKKAREAFETALQSYGREIPEVHARLQRKINKAKSRLFLHSTLLFSKNFLAHHKVPLDVVTTRSPYVWLPELYISAQQRYRAYLCNLRLIDLLPDDKNPKTMAALAVALSESALLRQAAKEVTTSRQSISKAIQICLANLDGQGYVQSQVLHNACLYYTGLGKWEFADDAIDEAHQLALDRKDQLAADRCELTIARMAYHRGWFPYALYVFQSTISSASSRGDSLREGNAHVGAAQCLLRLGRLGEAQKHLEATRSKLSYLGEGSDFMLEVLYRAMALRLAFYSNEYSKCFEISRDLEEWLAKRTPDEFLGLNLAEVYCALLEFHLVMAWQTHTAKPIHSRNSLNESTAMSHMSFSVGNSTTSLPTHALPNTNTLDMTEMKASDHIQQCRRFMHAFLQFSEIFPLTRPLSCLWYSLYNYLKERRDISNRLLKQAVERSFEMKTTWCLGMSFFFTHRFAPPARPDDRSRSFQTASGIFSKIGEVYYQNMLQHG